VSHDSGRQNFLLLSRLRSSPLPELRGPRSRIRCCVAARVALWPLYRKPGVYYPLLGGQSGHRLGSSPRWWPSHRSSMSSYWPVLWNISPEYFTAS